MCTVHIFSQKSSQNELKTLTSVTVPGKDPLPFNYTKENDDNESKNVTVPSKRISKQDRSSQPTKVVRYK